MNVRIVKLEAQDRVTRVRLHADRIQYLIKLAAKDGAPIDWCMILPTPGHRALVRSILPSSDILDVYQSLPRTPVGGDLGLLAEYRSRLAEDLGADKRPWGDQDGRKRFARGMDYHLLYKKFLIERGATHFLVRVSSAFQLCCRSIAAHLGVLFSRRTPAQVCRLMRRRARTCLQSQPSSSNAIESPRCRRRAAREFDVGELAALPKRFIFYPLQVTPEAPINTPAPYYIDKMRAIDALRLSMPPDCTLVVKEHSAGIGFRSFDLVRRLRKLPGLLVAKYTMNSRDLLLRASPTSKLDPAMTTRVRFTAGGLKTSGPGPQGPA